VNGTKTEIRPGVWRLRVYAGRRPNGTPIQVAKTFTSPDAAKGKAKRGAGTRLADRELAKMVAAVAKGGVPTGTETLGQLLDRWLAHCETIGRSPTTLREYRRLVDTVVRPALGKIRLSKLTAAHLDRLYALLTARGLKATSVRRVHALISAALHQAEKWTLVERNVSKRATPPAIHEDEINAPSPDEVRAVLAAAEEVEPALAAMLLVGALTGARRGELCALRWSDLDLENRRLTIARSVYEIAGGGWAEKGTKTHQARRIRLDDFATAVLVRHRKQVDELAGQLGLEVPDDAFIFSRSPVGSEPYRPFLVSKFTTRIARKAGVDTHLHALRHFSASQMIGAGHDVRTVAGRLGHRDASVTLRVYSHMLPDRDLDAAETLGKALAPG